MNEDISAWSLSMYCTWLASDSLQMPKSFFWHEMWTLTLINLYVLFRHTWRQTMVDRYWLYLGTIWSLLQQPLDQLQVAFKRQKIVINILIELYYRNNLTSRNTIDNFLAHIYYIPYIYKYLSPTSCKTLINPMGANLRREVEKFSQPMICIRGGQQTCLKPPCADSLHEFCILIIKKQFTYDDNFKQMTELST